MKRSATLLYSTLEKKWLYKGSTLARRWSNIIEGWKKIIKLIFEQLVIFGHRSVTEESCVCLNIYIYISGVLQFFLCECWFCSPLNFLFCCIAVHNLILKQKTSREGRKASVLIVVHNSMNVSLISSAPCVFFLFFRSNAVRYLLFDMFAIFSFIIPLVALVSSFLLGCMLWFVLGVFLIFFFF